MDDIADLKARVEALEQETAAYSALFRGLSETLGPAFLYVAAEIAESVEAYPQAGPALQKRMTEALRIIEDLRRGPRRKPEAGKVI